MKELLSPLISNMISPLPTSIVAPTVEDHVWFEDWWMVASWCDE
jgi:hypothetical protein